MSSLQLLPEDVGKPKNKNKNGGDEEEEEGFGNSLDPRLELEGAAPRREPQGASQAFVKWLPPLRRVIPTSTVATEL